MIALYETATGKLMSVGSTVVNPAPAGMTALDLGNDDRLLTGWGYWDPATKTVKNVLPSPVDRAAAMETLRQDIITKAIGWLEADAAAAAARATAIDGAVTTATTRRTQVTAFTFNGSSVTNINTQLNNSLKPILTDILTYIIGLGNITKGLETWRGEKADMALVWVAKHQTDGSSGN